MARDSARDASMSDVARHAGVSIATVSNALNHPDKLTESTREKVRRAIDELGFVRNNQARSLAMGQSNTIGLIVTDIGNSFFVDIARGAEEAAHAGSRTLLLANADNSPEKERAYLELFDEARFAGTLVAPFEASTESLSRLRRHGRPVVVLNVALDEADGCSVTVDNEYGGYIAAQHLIDEGCSRLAFVGGPDRLEPLLQRRLGVERAVRDARGRVSLEEIIVPAVNTPEGRVVARRIIDRAPVDRPDGVVAASDLVALGMVQAFHGSIAVPEEIAVIGYDNNNAVRESAVAISTVAQPGFAMGVAAAELVLDEVRSGADHVHRAVTLLPHLISRRSSSLAH
ncbi:LacI family transcriptional regulator [Agromyces atrinae]|uniref:LacI family DNA-binding transcriptional regulator n=1 Tax=Agromyces atrinae TaxID=592376 RepID=UPI001F575546|nr:LacI family DNA-binding transcriptional regulator [Agromyces atrinae]MCI2957134.1 LacI family transcriptional regulator [Agromyces atrinae]